MTLQSRPQACFLIAGEGPLKAGLAEQIKRLGLLGRVFLLGQVPDPASLLKCLDLFVLSSWGEGMGSVLLEAAACNVPVVATTAGGIPEIIEDARSGLLVKPRDPEALAKAVGRLIDQPGLARDLSARALENLPRFGLARMARQMEDVYAAAA